MERNDEKPRRRPTRRTTAASAVDDACTARVEEKVVEKKIMLASAWDALQGKCLRQPEEFSSLWEYAQYTGSMVRVDDEWYQLVHGDGNGQEMWSKLRNLMCKPPQSPDSGKLLMEEVHNIVATGMELLSPDVKTFVFPGPMAVPLTTRLNRFIAPTGAQASKYWLTEKSDGLRTMMYTKNIQHPRWLAVSERGQQLLSLYDALLLERTFQTLQKKKQTISKSGMPLSKAVRGDETLALRVDFTSNKSFLVNSRKEDYIEVMRSVTPDGMNLAYVFDRSCDVFLLLDEVTLAGGQSALVDGEFIRNLATGATEYLLYDIVLKGTATFSTANMSTRIEAMQQFVTERNHFLHRGNIQPVINIRTKEFYPSEGITELLSQITKVDDMYTYKRQNRNDGVVLTPEDGQLMAFRPGTCNHLFKWKQPDTLTADWHVVLKSSQEKKRIFQLSYNIKDKTPSGVPYEEHIPYKSTQLLAAQGVELSSEPQVVECKYEARNGYWKVMSIRNDKTTSNSYLTIASVLESQAENYTAETLQKALLGHAISTRSKVASAENFKRPFCCFILRSNKDSTSDDPYARRLTLQVRTKTTQHRAPRTFSYIPVDEVFGLDCQAPVLDRRSPLEHLLYIEVANRGGSLHWSDCVCNCKFDPALGRWEVLSVNTTQDAVEVKNHATINGVIQHLEEVCRFGMSPHTAVVTGVESVRGALVASDPHYAAKALDANLDTGRSCLRFFNNWVKSVGICEYAAAGAPHHKVSAMDKDNLRERKLVVLDLCCGRGGDLLKWGRQRPRLYVGVDSCLEAVGIAAKRYSDMYPAAMNNKSRTGMPAQFLVANAFSHEGRHKIQSGLNKGGEKLFNCVSCQFSLHYAFRSEESAATVLKTISSVMAAGGVFFGTIVDSEVLMKRRAAYGDTFGNSAYNVTFKEGDGTVYGQTYTFTLESCVEEEDEYVVDWDNFVKLAAEHGLVLHSSYNFKDFHAKHIEAYKEHWHTIFGTSEDTRTEENQQKKQSMSL
eukprot:TRINITY_DN10965_c0_g1_i1.p1 TRINITY_DN10965_c0_g1~~TRINITY_DN10965_c0_g1_i1.p1  ORF type:complete len:1014 (+),score=347.06 TRINITY_DN10965_c0_g1_i1:25-3042(+)